MVCWSFSYLPEQNLQHALEEANKQESLHVPHNVQHLKKNY